jgi:hypothetical protein
VRTSDVRSWNEVREAAAVLARRQLGESGQFTPEQLDGVESEAVKDDLDEVVRITIQLLQDRVERIVNRKP